MRVNARFVCFALAMALVTGPAAGAASSRHLIHRVPFVKQEPGGCGPAALESVLRYYNRQVTQREIAAAIALPDGRVLNLDLKLHARSQGFRAQSCRGTCERLKLLISRNTPVICQLRLGALGNGQYHFVVVIGYDEQKACFIAHTGECAAQEIGYLDFSRAWGGAEQWMLVIRPRVCACERPPQPEEPPASD